jgi:hypothetical protein
MASRSVSDRRFTAEMTPTATPENSARGAGDDQRLDRRLAGVGVAKAGPAVLVADEEPSAELAELHVPRPVEAEPVVDLGDLGIGRVLAGEPECRISRGEEVEDRERDREHAKDDDHRPDEPACDVERHVRFSSIRRRGRDRPAPSIVRS